MIKNYKILAQLAVQNTTVFFLSTWVPLMEPVLDLNTISQIVNDV
jgi:hypothetical protein